MTVTGQNGAWGFGVQSAKGTLATVFYRHRANDINFGPVQDLRGFPLEVGSIVTPTGAYKAGVFVAGGATIQPRLEGDLGWLFKALMGQATSTPGTASATAVHAAIAFDATSPVTTGYTSPPSSRRLLLTGSSITNGNITISNITGTYEGAAQVDTTGYVLTASGTAVTAKPFSTVTSIAFSATADGGSFSVGFYQTNSHVFTFAGDQTSLPWVSGRKKIPGAESFGEIGKDCRVVGTRLTAPQNGLIQARVDMVGREPSWEEGATVDSWAYGGLFENTRSVPATCVNSGYVKLPSYSGDALPITRLEVTQANVFTSPQEEMIHGSPYPDDFAVRSRAMSIMAVLKWPDAALYKKMLTGADLNWDDEPFETDFQCKYLSAALVPGSASVPYSLQVDAPRVIWTPQGSPVPAGGDILMLPIVGTVYEPDSGGYASLTVVNEQYNYS